jgi:hypothetical protein
VRPAPARAYGETVGAAVVFALAAGFLAWTALPGLHWHDTGEFAAVAWRLSVSHAPGHPLHAVVTRAVQEIPWGDGYLRANLASGLCVAAALALFFGLLRRLVPQAPRWAAGVAALVPVVLPAVWLQGVRAEVYGLQLLLAVVCGRLAWAVAGGDRRAVVALGLAFGLAGANHHLVGLSLLPVAVLAMVHGRVGLRGVGWGTAGGVLGLLTYAFLPLRARAGGEVGWGMPVDGAGIVETVLAREWVGADPATRVPLDLLENTQQIAAWIMEQAGLWGALVLFLGFALGLPGALRAQRSALVGLAAAAAGVAATRYLTPFDALNPDMGGYLAALLVALVGLAHVCMAHLPGLGVRGTGLWVLVAGLVAPGFDPDGRQGARVADAYGRAVLEAAPTDGALGLGDYATWFVGWGLRAVEGARPDVGMVFRGREESAWLWERLGQVRPDLVALQAQWPGGPWAGFTLHEPGPLGAPGVMVLPRAADFASLVVGVPDLDSRRFLGLHHLHRALALGKVGAVAEARAHLAAARALVGDDEALDEALRGLPPGRSPDGVVHPK